MNKVLLTLFYSELGKISWQNFSFFFFNPPVSHKHGSEYSYIEIRLQKKKKKKKKKQMIIIIIHLAPRASI